MKKATAHTSYDPYVAKLIEFSNRRSRDSRVRLTYDANRAATRWQPLPTPTAPDSAASNAYPLEHTTAKSHADPLSPLRSQDLIALNDLFNHEQMMSTESDIHQHLARLHPEPCWEDEPYDFLNGYL